MFCFEVTRPLNVPAREFDEGQLEWIDPLILPDLAIPQTDRDIIWPLVQQHSHMLRGSQRRQDIFSVHIDCTDPTRMTTTYEHPHRK
jgi:8-oxo-dGTP diphosphatase